MAPSPPDRTRRVLSAAQRHRHVLGFADCSATHATGDARVNRARQPDQLVLTRAGAVLLDSVEQPLDDESVALAVFSLVERAGLVKGSLGSVGAPHDVLPVVIVWGEQQAEVPVGGTVRHDVLFLRGADLRVWLRSTMSSGDALDPQTARELWQRLLTARPTSVSAGPRPRSDLPRD